MKKINYLLAFLAAAVAFSACNPLDKTYKDLGPAPLKTVPAQTITYTLSASDYQILPTTVPANSALAFTGSADANQYVPTILNSKYGTYPNGSTANITYNTIVTAKATTPTIKLADSVYNTTVLTSLNQPTGLEYTLVKPDDYLILAKNTNADFSVAQMLTWLNQKANPTATPAITTKYPNPVANQLEVLTWIYYPTLSPTAPQIYPGVSLSTTTVGTTNTTMATGSFLYLNGTWIQAYHLTPAQYAAVGRGQYNQFTASTDAGNLVSYFNGILKADASVTATATIGSIQYVSFNYYNNSVSPAVTSQRVIPMVFNGTNWTTGTVAATTTTAMATFTKSNGVWAGDPTVYYTVGGVGSADLTLIKNSNIGGTVLASDLASTVKYGDFDTYWVSLSPNKDNTWLNQAFILILTADFPSPKLNTPYKVSFPYYTNSKDVTTTYSYTWNGTAWVAGQ